MAYIQPHSMLSLHSTERVPLISKCIAENSESQLGVGIPNHFEVAPFCLCGFIANSSHGPRTSGGCRGEFVCDGVEKVVCDHMGGGTTYCECKPGTLPPNPEPHPVSMLPQVWMRPTADGGAAVVLHNPHDNATAAITVDFTAVPKVSWTSTTSLEVRDLWKHVSVGSATGQYTATGVAPHGSVFLKLTKAA
jgi:hypothetical protein